MSPPDVAPFEEPWQAQAFALAVSLNERGLFAWSEWTEAFGAELRRDDDYWRAWLATLEAMLERKGVAAEGELPAPAAAWIEAAEHTPHGQAIELKR